MGQWGVVLGVDYRIASCPKCFRNDEVRTHPLTTRKVHYRFTEFLSVVTENQCH